MPFSILQRLETASAFLVAGRVPESDSAMNALLNKGKSLMGCTLQCNAHSGRIRRMVGEPQFLLAEGLITNPFG